MSKNLEGLRHTPFGDEHPYRQGPEERKPRDPRQDEPVEIGALTWPNGAAEKVWVAWKLDGEAEEHTATASRQVVKDQQKEAWAASLPAFQRGQEVEYRVLASQGETVLSSQAYSFTVRGWQSLGEVAAVRFLSDQVELIVRHTQETASTRVNIGLAEAGLMRMAFELLKDSEAALSREDNQADRIALYRVEEQSALRMVLATGELRLVVEKQPYRLMVYNLEGKPLLMEADSPAWLVGKPGQPAAFRQQFTCEEGEGFYGFGERFNAFNQRGSRLDVRVFEQFFAEGKRTYIPMPYFLSSQGYGQYIHTHRNVWYDLAAENRARWSYEAEVGQDGRLKYTWMVGKPDRVIQNFSAMTGKTALPPNWAFGPWMSGNEWNSQARVEEELQKTLDLEIPATVLVIEAWSDESTFYIWNDAQYTPKDPAQAPCLEDFTFPANGKWPDPKAMIDRLHDLGIRLILWQIPVMKKLEEPHIQHNLNEKYMVEKGYCALNEDGSPYQVRPFWFHEAMLVDFTNKEAVQWWMDKRAYLIDEMGVDGFKTDGGEHLWARETRFANGMRGDEVWNLYPNLYVGAYYRYITEKKNGDAITFSRAGGPGAQAFPMHWSGDEFSTWQALREAVVAGLNSGISGIPFWGWDIGGFSGEIPTADLYLRSTAMAAFCPVMQYHSDFNHHRSPSRDRTPWNIAEQTGSQEVIEVYRKFANLRMKLLPYIEAEAAYCAETGEPMMRPLFLDWPEDPQCWEISDQYCFGRALLVAPVVNPDQSERRLYLPQGEWQDLWEGHNLTGGQWITQKAPLDTIPVYRRLDREFKFNHIVAGI
jgi:alpha-glucosidase (family GH31 glycosyl hydrolase)